jgi:hypothetical protein
LIVFQVDANGSIILLQTGKAAQRAPADHQTKTEVIIMDGNSNDSAKSIPWLPAVNFVLAAAIIVLAALSILAGRLTARNESTRLEREDDAAAIERLEGELSQIRMETEMLASNKDSIAAALAQYSESDREFDLANHFRSEKLAEEDISQTLLQGANSLLEAEKSNFSFYSPNVPDETLDFQKALLNDLGYAAASHLSGAVFGDLRRIQKVFEYVDTLVGYGQDDWEMEQLLAIWGAEAKYANLYPLKELIAEGINSENLMTAIELYRRSGLYVGELKGFAFDSSKYIPFDSIQKTSAQLFEIRDSYMESQTRAKIFRGLEAIADGNG